MNLRVVPSVAVVLAVALGGHVSAPATETAAAPKRLSLPTWIATHEGDSAWSEYDARADRFRLVLRVRGRLEVPGIRGRSRPFDVDLGPDRHGRTVAVYSRCRREPPRGTPLPDPTAGGGCEVFLYSPRSDTERRVRLGPRGASLTNPTIWRTRVGFLRRVRQPGGYFRSRAYVAALGGTGGPRRVPLERSALMSGLDAYYGPGVEHLDLRGDALAATTAFAVPACQRGGPPTSPEPTLHEVSVTRLRTGATSVVDRRCGFDPFGGAVFSPDGSLWYATGVRGRRVVRRFAQSALGESQSFDLGEAAPLSHESVLYTRYSDSGTSLLTRRLAFHAIKASD